MNSNEHFVNTVLLYCYNDYLYIKHLSTPSRQADIMIYKQKYAKKIENTVFGVKMSNTSDLKYLNQYFIYLTKQN